MVILSSEKLFSGVLPGDWHPLLQRLSDLDRLVESKGDDARLSKERRRQAYELRLQMLQQVESLDEELPPSLRGTSASYRQWFSQAVLLWPSFGDSCGRVLLDTIRSDGRPPDFLIDLQATDIERETLKNALIRMYGWTLDEIQEIQTHLNQLTSNLRLKTSITRSICDSFASGASGASGNGDSEIRAVELMRQIYGPLPWRPGDVDVVVTASELFLCVSYQDTALTCEGYSLRPAQERDQISDFLRRVHVEEQSLKSVRFPAFGIFDLKNVAPEFLSTLVESVRREPGLTNVDARNVAETFSTMVTVLQTSEVKKYLIHDAVGHAWQETLCDFERLFHDLSGIDGPLNGLDSAFSIRDGHTVLHLEMLRQVVETDLRRRIAIGLNVVISESLADIVEHKFARRGAPLPSSSLLPDCPLRIDLTLEDVKRMVRVWRKPYLALIQLEEERQRLCHELSGAGFPEPGISEAVAAAAVFIDRNFGIAFEDEMTAYEPRDGETRANVLQRIMLSMITFDAAIDNFLSIADARYKARQQLPIWRTPIACIDLLVLILGWFYEQERTLHVWHLDELINNELVTTLLRLEDALEER